MISFGLLTFALLNFPLGILATLQHNMVVLPGQQEKLNISGPAFQFSLFTEPQAQGKAIYSYAQDPPVSILRSPSSQQPQSIDLFSAKAPGEGLYAKSIAVERADAGAVIAFYTNKADKQPTFTLSFPLSVYERRVVNLAAYYDTATESGSIQLNMLNQTKAATQPIERITLSFPAPHFLIL